MLIAALIAAIAAAVAGLAVRPNVFDELLRYWRRAIRRRVDDPARRAAGEAKLAEFEREAAAMIAMLREWMSSIAELHRRYESTPADYDRLSAELIEDFHHAQVRLLAVADELREAIGDSAYFEITDNVEVQLRKLRARQQRRASKSTSR